MRISSTHYDCLKIALDAPPEVVRAAYRALAQKYHPDRNSDPDANAMMALVNEAHRVLSDSALRLEYDRGLGFKQRENRAPDERKSPAPRSDPPAPNAPPAAAPPPHPVASEVRSDTIDLESVWRAWFRRSSSTLGPSHDEKRGAQKPRPPGSHTVDLEETWRSLFASSGSKGTSKGGNRK